MFQFLQNLMCLTIHEPSVIIDINLIVFPLLERLIIGNDVYDVIFPDSVFSHIVTPSFIYSRSRIGSHILHRPPYYQRSDGNLSS